MTIRMIDSLSDLNYGDHITWKEFTQRPTRDLEEHIDHHAIVLDTFPAPPGSLEDFTGTSSGTIKVVHQRRSGVSITESLKLEPDDVFRIDHPNSCFPRSFTVEFAESLVNTFAGDIVERFPSERFPSRRPPISGSDEPFNPTVPFSGSHNERIPYSEWEYDGQYDCPCPDFIKKVKCALSSELEEYVAKRRDEGASIPESVEKVLRGEVGSKPDHHINPIAGFPPDPFSRRRPRRDDNNPCVIL